MKSRQRQRKTATLLAAAGHTPPASRQLNKRLQWPIRLFMDMDNERTAGLKKAYAILHLEPSASLDDVRRAYGALSKSDTKAGDNWIWQKEIDWAYEVLSEHLFTGRDGADTRGKGPAAAEVREVPESLFGYMRALIFPADDPISPMVYYGKAAFTLFLVVWGLKFVFAPIEGDYTGRSFMHLINLPFHEAGHVIFSFLGDFIRVLGGTLCQVLVPLVCVAAFVRKGDAFAAACASWWVGQSLIDAAPYIYDARAGELVLLGGVTGQDEPEFHDWHNILSRLGLLSWDHSIAYTVKVAGAAVIVASFAWCGWYLLRHHRDMGSGKV